MSSYDCFRGSGYSGSRTPPPSSSLGGDKREFLTQPASASTTTKPTKSVHWSPQLTQEQSPPEHGIRRQQQQASGANSSWFAGLLGSGGDGGGGDQGLRESASKSNSSIGHTPYPSPSAFFQVGAGDDSPVSRKSQSGPPLRSINDEARELGMAFDVAHPPPLSYPAPHPWHENKNREPSLSSRTSTDRYRSPDNTPGLQAFASGIRRLDEGIGESQLGKKADGRGKDDDDGCNDGNDSALAQPSLMRRIVNSLYSLLFG